MLGEIKCYYFYSYASTDTVRTIFPSLSKNYNLHIKFLDIAEPDNYALLARIKDKYNNKHNEPPVMVIGEHILGGKKEIKDSLELLLEKYKRTGAELPNIEAKQDTVGIKPTATSKAEVVKKEEMGSRNTEGHLNVKPVYLAYFYSEGCRECEEVSYELNTLSSKYPNLEIKKFDIEVVDNMKLNEALCELYGIPENKRLLVPAIFIGDSCFVREEINSKNIESLIRKYQLSGSKIPWENVKDTEGKAQKKIQTRFNRVSALAIFSAGLVDGINPCAIATLLFFISFLSFSGRKGKELLLVGITFTIAIFIVYYMIGIGIFRALRVLELTSIIRRVLFLAVGVLAIIFGILSIYDYFKLRAGKSEEVKLQLPRFLKRRIHTDIREKMKISNYIIGAGIVGFLVSISEFVCTGQVYLPTIMFVAEVPSLRIKALAYLFLYNIAFIIPLVIVFVLAYKGTSSDKLNLFWKKHTKSVKLITSVLFFILGGLLIFYSQ